MPTYYGAINLSKNELQNAVIQNLPSAPASPAKGQIYMDSTTNILYWWDGTKWVAAQGGTVAYGPVVAETTFGLAKNDGVATTLARSDHTHGTPTHTAADHSTIPISSFAPATGPVNIGGQPITGVSTPTNPTDAANKSYVDNAVAGLAWKDAVRLASTGNVALTGLTAIDGVTPVAGDRILLKNQTNPAENGIWIAAAGAWTRAPDADAPAELEGMAMFVSEGTTNADSAWVLTTNAPITAGTTPLTFAQFAGGGTVTAGAGMTQSGNTLNVIAGDTTLTVAADSVVVNTSVIATVASLAAYARKFAAALVGTVAYATGEVVTHNLNTRDIADVVVLNGASPYQAVVVDWEATTVNTVTVRYNPNLGAGYRVVVTG
jgi:hypothetical protein